MVTRDGTIETYWAVEDDISDRDNQHLITVLLKV